LSPLSTTLIIQICINASQVSGLENISNMCSSLAVG
jgi:hypothetical protein